MVFNLIWIPRSKIYSAYITVSTELKPTVGPNIHCKKAVLSALFYSLFQKTSKALL